jgi:hypothetical protein
MPREALKGIRSDLRSQPRREMATINLFFRRLEDEIETDEIPPPVCLAPSHFEFSYPDPPWEWRSWPPRDTYLRGWKPAAGTGAARGRRRQGPEWWTTGPKWAPSMGRGRRVACSLGRERSVAMFSLSITEYSVYISLWKFYGGVYHETE